MFSPAAGHTDASLLLDLDASVGQLVEEIKGEIDSVLKPGGEATTPPCISKPLVRKLLSGTQQLIGSAKRRRLNCESPDASQVSDDEGVYGEYECT